MIFLTVGHQLPFDRLVRAVDEWAAGGAATPVFGQIGNGRYQPRHFGWVSSLAPSEFDARMSSARAIVAHAGTGTIIAALRLGKPLLVLPRRAADHETRNDHQHATAHHFAQRGLVLAAFDEFELHARLHELLHFTPARTIAAQAPAEFVNRIREFALTGHT